MRRTCICMCQIWLPCYKNGISVFFFPVFSCRCQLLFFDLAEDLIGRNDTVFNYGVKEQTLNETKDIKVLYTLFTITHTHTHNIYACTIWNNTTQAISQWSVSKLLFPKVCVSVEKAHRHTLVCTLMYKCKDALRGLKGSGHRWVCLDDCKYETSENYS